jgi:maltose O-acetyltransferase
MDMNTYYKKRQILHNTAWVGNDVTIKGNVYVGKHSYINGGLLATGKKSKIRIGEYCAIGYNVNILAVTHDINYPTGLNKTSFEKDIIIGNNVWIGTNVFIREGINIGDNSIVGANSVVTSDVDENAIVGGGYPQN